MKVVTIGYTRDDGDFAVLATLNNNDDHMTDETFDGVVATNIRIWSHYVGEQVVAVERQDAPDYITLGE